MIDALVEKGYGHLVFFYFNTLKKVTGYDGISETLACFVHHFLEPWRSLGAQDDQANAYPHKVGGHL